LRNYADIWARKSVQWQVTYLLTELSPSWGAINWAATQELLLISWNPNYQYRIYKSLHWSLSWALSIQFTPSHPVSKIHFNIVHPPTSWSSQWSLSFWLSHHYPLSIPLLPHSCYMPHPSHPSWLDHSNFTWRRVQVMKLLIMQFSPISCHFIPRWSKYSPQHPQCMFLP
jgi:hypothetical protein